MSTEPNIRKLKPIEIIGTACHAQQLPASHSQRRVLRLWWSNARMLGNMLPSDISEQLHRPIQMISV